MSSRQNLLVVLKTALICALGTAVGIILFVDQGDRVPFIMAAGPFVVFITALGWSFRKLLPTRDPRRKRFAGGLIGVLACYLWSIIFFGLIGFGLYLDVALISLPVWLPGGVFGIAYAVSAGVDAAPSGHSVHTGFRLTTLLWRLGLAVSWTMAALVVVLSAFFWTLGRSEPLLYKIPDGYAGPILVVLDQSDGEPRTYEDGKRVYRIPSNGVLLSQFSPDRQGSLEYWYVDEQGQPVSEILEAQVCGNRRKFAGDPVVSCSLGGSDIINGKQVPYHSLHVVGPQSDLDVLIGGARKWREAWLRSLFP